MGEFISALMNPLAPCKKAHTAIVFPPETEVFSLCLIRSLSCGILAERRRIFL